MPSFQSLLKPCYVALFHSATSGRLVALAARGRNYRAAKQESEKRKAGEAKGEVGGSPARGCIHGGRALKTGRRVCRPKIMALTWKENLLPWCERYRTEWHRRAQASPARTRRAMVLSGTGPRRAIRRTALGR